MIVNDGKEDVALNYIKDKYTTIKVGDGVGSTSASQKALANLITTKTSRTPSVIGSTLVWTVDLLGSEIGSSGLSELGIFHKDTDKLLSRVTFTNTGAVAASDSVTFTIRIEVN